MKCWYCKEETMKEELELGKDWFKCSSCGATWIDTTHLGEGKVTYRGEPWSKWLKGGYAEARHRGLV